MIDTMTAAHAANTDCHCGGGSHAECCELECLVQPRFFCGQLLADQDLTALVDWIKAKSGLARFRHGWGVVCGLDVQCGRKGTVTVSPGYAMDHCGRDVIVCEAAKFDLTTCWPRPSDACTDIDSTGKSSVIEGQKGAATVNFGGFQLPLSEVQAIDLFIRYSESQSDSRTALARGGCGGAAGCEYTRVHEEYDLYCLAADECDEPPNSAGAWAREYTQELAALLDELRRLAEGAANPKTLQRLIDFVQRHPLHTFCFVREWLCDIQRTTVFPERWYDQAVFWIVQDWRNARFQASCRGGGPESGVRLARIWLWKRRENGNDVFSTLQVHSYPPFRRALANDTWPAPSGTVSLAPFIWQTYDAAYWPLRQLGLAVQKGTYTTIDSLQREVLFPRESELSVPQQKPFENHLVLWTSGSTLTAYTQADHCGKDRIVYFGWSGATDGVGGVPLPKPEAAPATPPPALPATPAPSAAPAGTDLKELSGIGAATAERLKAQGIRNVEDLANAAPADVHQALLGLGAVPPSEARAINLIQQAQEKVNPNSPRA
jgi:hypothetical protein